MQEMRGLPWSGGMQVQVARCATARHSAPTPHASYPQTLTHRLLPHFSSVLQSSSELHSPPKLIKYC